MMLEDSSLKINKNNGLINKYNKKDKKNNNNNMNKIFMQDKLFN